MANHCKMPCQSSQRETDKDKMTQRICNYVQAALETISIQSHVAHVLRVRPTRDAVAGRFGRERDIAEDAVREREREGKVIKN